MAIRYNTSTVSDSLMFYLDAANIKSYPGSGTTWSDLSGNGRDATLVNSISISDGSASLTPGTNDYARISHDATISSAVFGANNGYTLESWCRFDVFQNWTCMISKAFGGSWSNTTSALWCDSGGNIRFVIGTNQNSNPAGSYTNSASFSASTDTWYHVVGVNDGTNAKLYINGTFRSQHALSNITLTRTENTNDITIGRRGTGTGPSHDGNISVVKAYSRALTDSEVMQNFNGLRGRYGL